MITGAVMVGLPHDFSAWVGAIGGQAASTEVIPRLTFTLIKLKDV